MIESTEDAMAFLTAGGSISLTEWAMLEQEQRQALFDAGAALRREMASLIGIASQGPEQARIVSMDPEDIIEYRVQMAVEAA